MCSRVSGFSGMERWTGMVEWNGVMDGVANYNRIEYLCVMVVSRGQTAFSLAQRLSIRDDKRLFRKRVWDSVHLN